MVKPLKGQLAEAGYLPADITYVAFSHYHWDHTANGNDFAGATWLVRQVERDAMFSVKPTPLSQPSGYTALRTAKTIIISGVSKAYAMTGWRIGWSIAPVELTTAIDNLQSQETSNPCSVSQYAALAAIDGPQDSVAEMAAKFTERRDYVIKRFREIPNIKFVEPTGAFYMFFDVSAYFGKKLGGEVLCELW